MNATREPKSKLDIALSVAARGLPVFPLEPGSKHPSIDDWPAKATTDPDKIRKFWTCPVTGWPVNRDVAVALGGGLLAVDIDVKNGKSGETTWGMLELEHGAPATLTARTQSGGRHKFFKTQKPIGNGVDSLGDGVDHRGERGYVKWYDDIENDAPIAPAPEWLTDRLGAAPEPKDHGTATARLGADIDSPANITRAIDYLLSQAPEAIEGNAGDHTTYRVATAVKDYGIGEGTCLDLMLDHWNDRQSPPWPQDELARKVANAYAYGQNPIGIFDPHADFTPPPGAAATATGVVRGGAGLKIHAIPYDRAETDLIPPREWILGTSLLAGAITMFVAPPGTGKSALSLAVSLAVATGRNDMTGEMVHRRGRVWVHNNEDDRHELLRRVRALEDHHGLRLGADALLLTSGADHPLKIAKRTSAGGIVPTEDAKALEGEIVKLGVQVFIIDPLVSTHDVNENDNREAEALMSIFRGIAARTRCALLIVHHTNKPPAATADGRAGDMNSARGASAFLGAVRIARTLYNMTSKEAAAFGIPDGEQWRYARLDDAKGNYGARTGNARWFRKESVSIPNGDSVGALAPVVLRTSDEDAKAADEESARQLAQEAVALFSAGQTEMPVDRIARQLIADWIGRGAPSRPTLNRRIESAFSPLREVDGFVWSIEHGKRGIGSKAALWLVRLAKAGRD